MIGYVCKYTPIEIMEAFDEEVMKIEPDITSFEKSSTLMHPNMCTYSKAVLEQIIENKIDKVVLTTCCDSIKRLHDVLLKLPHIKFVYIINIPRKRDETAINLFKMEIEKFIYSYENFNGNKFNPSKFANILKVKNFPKMKKQNNINVAIMGARCKKSTIDAIENSGMTVLKNLTCTGEGRNFKGSYENFSIDNILYTYAKDILNLYPCLRMTDTDDRFNALKRLNNIHGIIYHTVKFCDSYSYEYSRLKSAANLPVLKIETDYTEQCEGQIKTRIEAFSETLRKKYIPNKNNKFKARDKIVVGIDSGSTSTNAVIIDSNKNILSYSSLRTGAKSIESAKKVIDKVLESTGINKSQVDLIVSTGYGRVSLPFSDMDITEITCHGRGAFFINDKIRTIIDIGGQDSKVIRINENGDVTDFVMNDKCAAGTGRFLEMMARTLEIDIDSMGEEALKWKEDISITNMCTVFAESEVISLIALNKEKSDIIHGLDNSIASRVISLLGRIGKMEGYMMTGGVAKNIGVVKALEEKLNTKIYIPREPEIVGALGAALEGLKSL